MDALLTLLKYFQKHPDTVAAYYGRGVAYARKGLNVRLCFVYSLGCSVCMRCVFLGGWLCVHMRVCGFGCG